jgi:hypothetical protein
MKRQNIKQNDKNIKNKTKTIKIQKIKQKTIKI